MKGDALKGYGFSACPFKATPFCFLNTVSLVYPHRYSGCNCIVILRLQAGLRCKIFKTKEFPAKSSRIRSYGPFRPLPADWRREEGVPGRFEGRLLRIIVHEVGK
jgi:hypothetical protein